jgi:outer membrane lipoprotein-sorting protein
VFCGLLLLVVALAAPAQEIVTAQEFFGKVSAKFGTIKDYSCDFTYARSDTVSSGKMYYRAPNLLRLDFSTPKGQVILSNGEKLEILIPSLSLILEQKYTKANAPQGVASDKALRMLADNYDVAYLDSPAPVALDAGSKEMVTKLKLTRRNASEMHREITLSISKDLFIRRWEGVLEDRTSMVMDYTSVKLNQSLPVSRFTDDAWPEANVYSDFLTGSD